MTSGNSQGLRIGFVGLGRMGRPMSARLAAAGYHVAGYDVSGEARRQASVLGVVEAATLGDVARGCDVLVLMLPGSEAVEGVLAEPTLLHSLSRGALVVDMSSSQPLRTREVAASLASRGFRMLDAPVSGGVSGAQAGTLTIMVGGDPADLAAVRPCLEVLGRVVHTGAIGSGHAVKALNNLLSATHLWVTSEAMVAGQRFGIDPKVMLEVFNTSSGRSGSTDNKWPNFILTGTFDSGFGLSLMIKDIKIAVELAQQVGAPSLLGPEVLDLWARAAGDLPSGADHTEVAKWLLAEGATYAS